MLSAHIAPRSALGALLALCWLAGPGTLRADPLAKPPLALSAPRAAAAHSTPAPTSESAAKRSTFATVDLYAAASAAPEGITFTGHVTLSSIASSCTARFVDFSGAQIVGGLPTMGDEPSVAVVEQRFCVRVSSDPALEGFVGRRVLLRPVTLPEFLNGEEYSSPDPADLQAAGVSIYLPDERFGHQLGIFVLAGYLEAPDGVLRQANALVGAAVTSGGQGFAEQRYLLILRSPAGTQVNVMGLAPTAELESPQE